MVKRWSRAVPQAGDGIGASRPRVVTPVMERAVT